MDFYELVDKALDVLRRRGRLTYRSLKIQFQLDDEQLEALQEEIQYAHEASVEADDRELRWTGGTDLPDRQSVAPEVVESPPASVAEAAERRDGHQAHALRLLAEVASHRDRLEVEQAESHFQQALTLTSELGMRPLQGHCHRGLGALYGQIGKTEQA